MSSLRAAAIGAAAFIGVHLLLAATWQMWVSGSDGLAPWFMNAWQTVAATALVFAALNLIIAVASRVDRLDATLQTALAVAAGAVVPMIVVLFRLPGGPGNLFPIAIAIGTVILVASSALGAALGWAVRRGGTAPGG